jgi:hypothetical protein
MTMCMIYRGHGVYIGVLTLGVINVINLCVGINFEAEHCLGILLQKTVVSCYIHFLYSFYPSTTTF